MKEPGVIAMGTRLVWLVPGEDVTMVAAGNQATNNKGRLPLKGPYVKIQIDFSSIYSKTSTQTQTESHPYIAQICVLTLCMK